MFDRDQIRLLDENGIEKLYDIVLTFDNEKTRKSYIIYTDNKETNDGECELYASIYNPEDPTAKFEKIETEEEWEVINILIKRLQESLIN